MKQLSFSSFEQSQKKKRTKREVFLGEMDGVVPWPRLEGLISPHYTKPRRERPQMRLAVMLRLFAPSRACCAHPARQWIKAMPATNASASMARCGAGQGRARVWRRQMPVRISQSALSRAGQKHRPNVQPDGPRQPLHGAKTPAGGFCLKHRKSGESSRKRAGTVHSHGGWPVLHRKAPQSPLFRLSLG